MGTEENGPELLLYTQQPSSQGPARKQKYGPRGEYPSWFFFALLSFVIVCMARKKEMSFLENKFYTPSFSCVNEIIFIIISGFLQILKNVHQLFLCSYLIEEDFFVFP